MTYLKAHVGTKNTPVTEPISDNQVKNNAGGFVYAIGDFAQFQRFLVLGTSGGTYYVNERKSTKENLKVVKKCIASDPLATVNQIVAVSESGRAPKNDQAILALAMCVAAGGEARKLALAALPKVCRIGTHLFMFMSFLQELDVNEGARSIRRALGEWYTTKTVDQAAYQTVKYRQREGWTHRDVLRVAHPAPSEHAKLFSWITKGAVEGTDPFVSLELPPIVEGYELAQTSESIQNTVNLIHGYNLPREALKTEHLNSPEVWEALLETGMGTTALIRNLGNMTKIGLLTPTSAATKLVLAQLRDEKLLRKSRVHPLAVLVALTTYQSGQGFRGGSSWQPVPKIVDALDGAFYKAFGNVEPTGKNVMLALDVSGSMSYGDIAGTNITPAMAASAMAMVTYAVEDSVGVYGFSTTFQHLDISDKKSLPDVMRYVYNRNFGGTDCSLPMKEAKRRKLDVDLFVVYTDNETWAGGHPTTALKEYRRWSGRDARLAVVGMTSTGFSIADPKDPGQLDVVGFDTATPQIISDFGAGLV